MATIAPDIAAEGKNPFSFEPQSPLQEIADMHLATLFTLHASPSILAIGFSILLVLTLVAAEEVEVRRGRIRPDQA